MLPSFLWQQATTLREHLVYSVRGKSKNHWHHLKRKHVFILAHTVYIEKYHNKLSHPKSKTNFFEEEIYDKLL